MFKSKKITEKVYCPLCGFNKTFPYKTERFHLAGNDVELGLNICCHCQLHYVSPRLNSSGLSLLYNEYYLDKTVSGQYNTSEEVSNVEYISFIRYIKKFSAGQKWRLLDVGCGIGNLLNKLLLLPNINSEGIEYSTYATTEAKKKGLNVSNGTLPDTHYENNSFDCVVLLYVLEHIQNPNEVISDIFRILKPEGYLMVAVPNYRYLKLSSENPLIRAILQKTPTLHPEEHLQNFTPKTLLEILSKNGFTKIKFVCASPLKTGPFYIYLIKSIATLIVKFLFILGYHIGGIHLIVQKPKK